MVYSRNRILPDQIFCWHFRAQVTGLRSHVTVGQFEPGTGKSIVEFIRIFQIAFGDGIEFGIKTQGKICRCHHRGMAFVGVVRVFDCCGSLRISRHPLKSTGRALDQIPVIFKQCFQIAHVPSGWFGFPCAFQTAANGVATFATAEGAFPAQSLFFDRRGFRFPADMSRGTSAMALTKGVAARNQRDGFFIIHRHAGKGLTNISS